MQASEPAPAPEGLEKDRRFSVWCVLRAEMARAQWHTRHALITSIRLGPESNRLSFSVLVMDVRHTLRGLAGAMMAEKAIQLIHRAAQDLDAAASSLVAFVSETDGPSEEPVGTRAEPTRQPVPAQAALPTTIPSEAPFPSEAPQAEAMVWTLSQR